MCQMEFIRSSEVLLHTTNIPCFKNDGVIDRLVLEQMMLCDTLDPYVSFRATIEVDALQHVDRSHRYVLVSDLNYRQCSNQYSSINHIYHIWNLAYFHQINNTQKKKKHSMEHLFDKLLPQSCQGRTAGKSVIDLLKKKRNLTVWDMENKKQKTKVPSPVRFKVLRKIQQLIKMSLLGNYVHVRASTRPTGIARLRIQTLCDSEEFIYCLAKHCGQLISYTLRDYMVYAIQDDAALLRYMTPYMNFESFKDVTNKYMDQIREYFNVQLQLDQSSLSIAACRGIESVKPMSDATNTDEVPPYLFKYIRQTYHDDLSIMFRDSKPDHLLAKYHRPNIPFVKFILQRKNKHPWPKDIGLLTQEQIKAIQYIVDNTSRSEFLPVLIVLLPTFGITDPAVLRSIRLMIQLYEQSTISVLRIAAVIDGKGVDPNAPPVVPKKKSSKSMKRKAKTKTEPVSFEPGLIHSNPFLYRILQTGAILWSKKYKLRVIQQLPAHYVINQLNAAQQSLGLQNTHYVLDTQTCLCYCNVCDTIYSLIRTIDPTAQDKFKGNEKEKDKKEEDKSLNLTCGFFDPMVDYDTGKMYCKHYNKTNPKLYPQPDGSNRYCGETSLSFHSLIGNAIKYEPTKQIIMLCPQDNCCEPFEVTTDCAYTERGLCCSDCTTAVEQTPLYYDKLLQEYNHLINEEVKCSLCFNRIDTPKKVYPYPCDIVLCRKHNTSRIVKRITELVETSNLHETICCDECNATGVLLGFDANTHVLCITHYNRMRLSECKECMKANEYETTLTLCEAHENDMFITDSIYNLNRCIIMTEIHKVFKEAQLEKAERHGYKKDKFNKQRSQMKTMQSQQRRR